jgi:hypothetical protein
MNFYPFNYLTLPFPIPLGLTVYFLVHMILAAAGMRFWLKSLGLSENSARIGSLAFALSGFFWWEIIHPPILAVFACFPWLLGLLEKYLKNLSLPWAFLCGLGFAVIVNCANSQSSTYVFYTALAYLLFRFFTKNPSGFSGRLPSLARGVFSWKKVLASLLFFLWGALPLLIHLIPAGEYFFASNRRVEKLTYGQFNGAFSVVPHTTYELLFPTWGLPRETSIEEAFQNLTNMENTDNDFLANVGYLGIWMPLLVLFALRMEKNKNLIKFLLAFALFSVLASWGRYFPLHRLLCAALPGMGMHRSPYRFLEIFTLFGSALMAFGYEWLENHRKEKSRWKNPALPAIIYGSVMMIPCLLRPDRTWIEMTSLVLGIVGLSLPGLPRPWKVGGPWLFTAALLLPLLLTGWNGYHPASPSNYDYEKIFPPFGWLKDQPKDGRYYFSRSLPYFVKIGGDTYRFPFPIDAVMDFGIRAEGGYNPLTLKKTDDLKNLPFETYLRLMSVKGLFLERSMGERPGFSHKKWGPLDFYEPLFPPVYLNAPGRIWIAPDDGSDLKILAGKDFDPKTQVVLNEPLRDSVSRNLSGAKANLRYSLVKDGADDQLFDVHLDRNSLVTFSEVNFPGWRALLDGRPAGILTANHAFRALWIPAGDHKVEFSYVPGWLHPLLWFIMAWTLSAACYAFFVITRRFRH